MSVYPTLLITGANGFIGHALYLTLKNRYSVEQMLVPSSKELNLLDTNAVEAYFHSHKIDVVYHTAAKHAGVGSGISKPLHFLETNLLMNLNIVMAARKYGVHKFITFGSSCTYQTNLDHPAKEEDLWDQRAENEYGTCKQVLLEHLQAQNTMKWVYFIPPNLYGPGDHFGEAGTHFVPATVQKFQVAKDNGYNHITVWGDGSQTRDFVYVNDIIGLLLEALESKKYDNRAINVATGKQISIKYVAEQIQHHLHLDNISLLWDKEKPMGLVHRELDNTQFMHLNPNYQFTQIEEGIQHTIKWYLDERIKMRYRVKSNRILYGL